jgi:hypothetical protein
LSYSGSLTEIDLKKGSKNLEFGVEEIGGCVVMMEDGSSRALEMMHWLSAILS